MKNNNNNNKKDVYLEALRVISIIFVLFNHTNTRGFFLFSLKSPNSIFFWILLIVSIFCKFAVPIFFMISGSLLLRKKDEDLKTIFKKRILKIVLALLVFSTLYYIYSIIMNHDSFEILTFVKKMFRGRIVTPFWYLYMYLGFLLSLPFLRQLVHKLKSSYFEYLILLSIIINGFIPIIYYILFKEQLTTYKMITPFWLVDMVILYPCIGYFIDNKLSIKKLKSKLPLLWAINIFTLLISAFMTYKTYKVTGVLNEKSSQIFFDNFALINAMCIFITVKCIFTNTKETNIFNKLFLALGKYTFGIYIIHPFINDNIYFRRYIYTMHTNSYLRLFIIVSSLYLGSLIITYILSKIPKVKKLIGF